MPNRPPDDEPQPRSSLDDESADTTPERGTDEPERGLGDLAQRSDDDDSDALDLGILEPRPTDDNPDDPDSDASVASDHVDASDIDVSATAGPSGDDDAASGSTNDEDRDGANDVESSDDAETSDTDDGDDPDESGPTDATSDDDADDRDDADDEVGPDESGPTDATSDDDAAASEDDDAEPFEDDGSSPLVKAGPRWYRSQIRRFGPVAALAPMGGFGLIAWLALTLSDSRTSGIVGLVAGAAAAPGLLVAGAPFGDSDYYPFVVMASIPFWLALGWLAARRATRRPVMSWRDYVRELVWLALAVVVGVIVALSIASAQLGEPLLS